MSDYTPSVDEVRTAWVEQRRQADPYAQVFDVDPEYAAEFSRMIEAVRAEERERCARIAERSAAAYCLPWEIADLIRANRKDQGS